MNGKEFLALEICFIKKILNEEKMKKQNFRQTTILCVRRNNSVAMGSDGQVTFGDTIVKHSAVKVRKLFNGKVLAGFAGAAADALTLLSRIEDKLQSYGGNLYRSAIELAKDWRSDRILRRLEAQLIVADKDKTFLISGAGDVVEPDDSIIGIGSGGGFAVASARALYNFTELSAEEIVHQSMLIASQICIYTNDNITVEVL